jgi:sugar phosphate isomerase/epimerase
LRGIAQAASGMQRIYSSPDGLWAEDGTLDHAALEVGLARARMLAAARLKMSIGGWRSASAPSLAGLRDRLGDTPVELVIENDQTAAAGTQGALARFFSAAESAGLALGLTFDIGNWHWAGECPQAAAAAFSPRVRYVHCKGVQRQPHRWVAVPIADSAAPWRAVLRAMPAGVPWAIEYPLAGDDLEAVTRREIEQLREAARSL